MCAQLTAASLSWCHWRAARVTNPAKTGRSVDVLVNDRGPYARNRVMDLLSDAGRHRWDTKTVLAQVSSGPGLKSPGWAARAG